MHTVRSINARKLASAGMELIGKEQWQEALDKFNEAAVVYIELEDPLQRSNMLSLVGLCLYAMGRLDDARDALLEAIELKKQAGAEEGMATDLLGLGEILLKKGDHQEAERKFSESLLVFERLGIADGGASAKRGLEKVKKAISASDGR